MKERVKVRIVVFDDNNNVSEIHEVKRVVSKRLRGLTVCFNNEQYPVKKIYADGMPLVEVRK